MAKKKAAKRRPLKKMAQRVVAGAKKRQAKRKTRRAKVGTAVKNAVKKVTGRK